MALSEQQSRTPEIEDFGTLESARALVKLSILMLAPLVMIPRGIGASDHLDVPGIAIGILILGVLEIALVIVGAVAFFKVRGGFAQGRERSELLASYKAVQLCLCGVMLIVALMGAGIAWLLGSTPLLVYGFLAVPALILLRGVKPSMDGFERMAGAIPRS